MINRVDLGAKTSREPPKLMYGFPNGLLIQFVLLNDVFNC